MEYEREQSPRCSLAFQRALKATTTTTTKRTKQKKTKIKQDMISGIPVVEKRET